jgi:hypothetical protein
VYVGIMERRGREIGCICGNCGKERERNRVCMWELWKGEGEKWSVYVGIMERRGREIECVCGNYGKERERNRVCLWELWKGEGEK